MKDLIRITNFANKMESLLPIANFLKQKNKFVQIRKRQGVNICNKYFVCRDLSEINFIYSYSNDYEWTDNINIDDTSVVYE